MKPKILLCCFMLAFLANAQPPWRAKLFVHFKDSNNQIVTDTVWFGCDSLGAEGFQEGLDIIDTNVQYNKVYSSDAIIQSQYNTGCVNLKTNIREFNVSGTRVLDFQFYTTGRPVSMSWDTADFIYQIDSIYRINGIFIHAQNGYLYAIDAQDYILGGDWYTKINNEYIYGGFDFEQDSIRIFPESLVSGCNGNITFSFKLTIGMGWFVNTGLDNIVRKNEFAIYPNPVIDQLNIETEMKGINEYTVMSIEGTELLSGNIQAGNSKIGTSLLKPGIYFIYLHNSGRDILKPTKFLKL